MLCPHVFLTLTIIEDLNVCGYLCRQSDNKQEALKFRRGFISLDLVDLSVRASHYN